MMYSPQRRSNVVFGFVIDFVFNICSKFRFKLDCVLACLFQF